MVTVDLRVPQGQQLSSTAEARDRGGQRGLRGAQSGARAAQRALGLQGRAAAQNDGLTVEQRVGGGLQNEFGTLNALVLSTLGGRMKDRERKGKARRKSDPTKNTFFTEKQVTGLQTAMYMNGTSHCAYC